MIIFMSIDLELINFVRNEYLRLFNNNTNIYPKPLIESLIYQKLNHVL